MGLRSLASVAPGCHAALSHIAVSNALLIIGMFMPKFGFTPFFDTAFGAGFSAAGASSTRSQALASAVRATAKD
jgi:hypothetical protein